MLDGVISIGGLEQFGPTLEKLKNTFRVGEFTCELSWEGRIKCEWSPDVPDRPLNKKEWKQYRRGRDAWLVEVAKIIGGPVGVLEI